jgi:hypothetical protein
MNTAVVKPLKAPGLVGAKLESITPAMAEEWLKTMVKNRAVSEAKVWEYAFAMDEGRWSPNGETIKFDADGHLFDGQHRLLAGIRAEKPFLSLVVRGISDAHAFATVDTGKGRTHADIFGIEGWHANKTASGAAMLIKLYQDGRLGWGGVTNRRLKRKTALAQKAKGAMPTMNVISREELVDFASEIREELDVAVRFGNTSKASRVMPTATVAALYYIFRDKSRADADQFFLDLGEGLGLERHDAVYALREKLMQSKASKSKLTRWAIFGLTIKAWNKRRAKEYTKVLGIQANEEFPRAR